MVSNNPTTGDCQCVIQIIWDFFCFNLKKKDKDSLMDWNKTAKRGHTAACKWPGEMSSNW